MTISRSELINWVKSRLGYPTIMLELDDYQIDTCIDDAIEELSPWIIQPKFVTLPVSDRIDLSDYNVAYVVRVHKSSGGYSSSDFDVFNPMTQVMTVKSSGLGYSSRISSTYASMELMNSTILSKKDNISFKYIDPYLYLDIGYPKSPQCVVEYTEKIRDVDDITDDLYIRFLKKFTLAYTRLILYEIRGKYTVANSPTTLNADAQLDQANKELDELREQLKLSVNTNFIID